MKLDLSHQDLCSFKPDHCHQDDMFFESESRAANLEVARAYYSELLMGVMLAVQL